MSQRYVYLVDADANLNAHLVGELGHYGFRVDAAVDSNELMQLKDDLPSLIVLCIDPKRTGWAVCNRLRKSATLKTTPLIITSAEATEKDFEDHKKLKTRAEEYLHKPFAVEALAEKIGGLIGMPDPDRPVDAVARDPDGVGGSRHRGRRGDHRRVARRGAALRSGVVDAARGAVRSRKRMISTRIGVMNVDGEVDVETEAAFAAIGAEGMEDSTSVTQPEEVKPMLGRMVMAKKAVPMPSVTEVPMDEAFGDDDDPFSLPSQPGAVPAPLPPAESQPIDTFRAQQTKEHVGADRPRARRGGGAGVARAGAAAAGVAAEDHHVGERRTVERRRSARVLAGAVALQQSAADTQAHDTGTAAVTELKRERDTLKREVEDLKQKLAAKPAVAASGGTGGGGLFARARVLEPARDHQQKEREVLDLKDAADAKERAVLDAPTKLRDNERKLRDPEERSLAPRRSWSRRKRRSTRSGTTRSAWSSGRSRSRRASTMR